MVGESRSSQCETTPLHLLVIGAGLAGLSAALTARLEGHRVTILEKVAELAEVGAGLQVTPNATRLFQHWGIADALEVKAAVPTSLSVRRYDGTKVLAHEADFQQGMHDRYAAPFWDLHRADLQEALARKAKDIGVELRLAAEVVAIDFDAATVQLGSGEEVRGDVLLGADGLWSRCRSEFLGRPTRPMPTGDLAFRIILNLDELEDSELRDWVSNPTVNFWIGPQSHAVGYSVRNGTQFNLVLLSPDDLAEESNRAAGNVEEMRELFSEWDPILLKFLSCVQSVEKWRLMHQSELESWTNEAGTFVMAGDACHPMLPYLAQGANSALEDGAVLGRLLGHVKHTDQIPQAMQLYQDLRKSRGEAIARETFKQREAFHMVDGPLQAHRDTIFVEALASEPTANFPSRWTCPTVQPWLYGYDAIAEADRAWETAPGLATRGNSLSVS